MNLGFSFWFLLHFSWVLLTVSTSLLNSILKPFIVLISSTSLVLWFVSVTELFILFVPFLFNFSELFLCAFFKLVEIVDEAYDSLNSISWSSSRWFLLTNIPIRPAGFGKNIPVWYSRLYICNKILACGHLLLVP